MPDDFIARANIEHFIRLLTTEKMDYQKRTTIERLLAEEERKLLESQRRKRTEMSGPIFSSRASELGRL